MIIIIFLHKFCWWAILAPQRTTWIFHLYFQLHYLPEETSFQQVASSGLEGSSQLVIISIKCKTPALLLLRKMT
jgi:hypothetical protein